MVLSTKNKIATVLGGLATIVALSQTDILRKSTNYVMDKYDTYMIERDVTQGYVPSIYRIRRGDTLYELARGNTMIADYIKQKNGIRNVGSLQPGTEIIILIPSENGKILRELLADLERSAQ